METNNEIVPVGTTNSSGGRRIPLYDMTDTTRCLLVWVTQQTANANAARATHGMC